MKYIVVLSLLLIMPLQAAEKEIGVVGAEFWANPRHGQQVIQHPLIAQAVKFLLAEPEAYMILSYPETEEGELWGLELQAWLVSLGVVSDRIELQPGYDGGTGIKIVVESTTFEQVEEESASTSLEEGAVGE